MHFRSAGLDDPMIEVGRGPGVAIRFVKRRHRQRPRLGAARPVVTVGATIHGPRVPGSVGLLGNATAAGAPETTAAFTADPTGTLGYECPIPGQNGDGMQACSW
jgi:hypothetical protein